MKAFEHRVSQPGCDEDISAYLLGTYVYLMK